jgi:hypothetical protein
MAMERFARWIDRPALAPPQRIAAHDAIEAACDRGQWRGIALFLHEHEDWAIFDDLSGALAPKTAEQWRGLAGADELVFAGYNDAVPYGQLLVVRGGVVIREFLDDQQDPSQNVNRGKLESEDDAPITNWIEVASFVDEDELADQGVENGLLWIFQSPGAA